MGSLRRDRESHGRPEGDDPVAIAEALADAVVAQPRGYYGQMIDQGTAATIVAAPERVRMALAPAMQRRIRDRLAEAGRDDQDARNWFSVLGSIVVHDSLGRRPEMEWSPETMVPVADGLAEAVRAVGPAWWGLNVRATVATLTWAPPTDPELRRALRDLALALHATAEEREQIAYHRAGWERITAVLGEGELVPPDVWRTALDAAEGPLPNALRELAAKAPAKPSSRFRAKATAALDRLGREACEAMLVGWLTTLATTRPPADHPPTFPAATTDRVVGVVCVADALDGPAITAALADLAIAGYRKVRAVGARCAPVATTCTKLLAERPDALPQLARVQHRVTHPPSRTKVERTLASVAERLQITPAELEEIVVPEFGLDGAGELRRTACGVEHLVGVDGDDVRATWTVEGGKPRKSLPAELKAGDPKEAGAQRDRVKALKAALPVQRRRIEALLREDREWPLDAWRVRYVEHGLVGTIARRLVWRFVDGAGERAGVWRNGRPIGTGGTPLTVDESTRVRLWHPVGAPDGEAAELRSLLDELATTAPFPQIDRETWRPPPPGSGQPFVGRRVRQHAMAEVLRARGWRFDLRSALWDSGDEPTIELPAWDLRACLALRDELDANDDPSAAASSDRGILLEVELGDISFATTAGVSIAPDAVPLLVYSEVLRDVSLAAVTAAPEE